MPLFKLQVRFENSYTSGTDRGCRIPVPLRCSGIERILMGYEWFLESIQEDPMNISDTALEIRTLGGFSISAKGKPVVVDWPNETIKALFCTLISPLDVSFTWDRICRYIWDVPATQTTMLRLEEIFIRPLTSFLFKELGFNPLTEGHEGIRIDLQRFKVDAHEFHRYAVEGLSLLSHGNYTAAREKLGRADLLYIGSYLPGIPGRIITDTRNDLESLYRTAIRDALMRTRNSGCSVRLKRDMYGMYLLAA